MAITTTEVFLVALLLILSLPWLVWRLAGRDRFAPLVVVQIICGIVLGPGVLGAAWPEYYAFIFRPEVVGPLTGIAWWAVTMYVFAAGVELDLRDAWCNRRETSITAGLALGVPLVAGCLAGAVLLAVSPGWVGSRGNSLQVIVGLGMACAVTALPILVLLMEKLGIFRQPLGQRVLRYASLDDIVIWAVLALILLDWARLGRQAAFLVAFALAAAGIRRLFLRLGREDRWYAAMIWLAAVALAADWAGLHFMVGGFLAGLVLEARWFGRAMLDGFRRFLLLTVMPVFFLSTGLRTQWGADGGGVGFPLVAGAAALLLAAAVGGKLAGVHLAGRILGWAKGEAWIIGWLLQTKALIMIIFANVLLDRAIITPATFTALLLMALASTMLTMPAVQRHMPAPGDARRRGLPPKPDRL